MLWRSNSIPWLDKIALLCSRNPGRGTKRWDEPNIANTAYPGLLIGESYRLSMDSTDLLL